MLDAVGLGKRFGGLRTVDGVSFTLRSRTIAGLIGPNGASKTMLFNLIAGVAGVPKGDQYAVRVRQRSADR